MPSFKSISFKIAVLQGGGQNLIQKTPCGIGLRNYSAYYLSVHLLLSTLNNSQHSGLMHLLLKFLGIASTDTFSDVTLHIFLL